MLLNQINTTAFSSNVYYNKASKPINQTRKESVDTPVFNAGKKVQYDEIIKFHKDIEQKKNRDRLSYGFYTTPQDIGSGLSVLALPISRADDKAKDEMLKEIKRLLSKESTLSFEEKKMLRYLYQNVAEIECR